MSIPFHGQPSPSSAPQASRIDFSWIGEAWALFSAQTPVWIGAILLFFLLDIAVWFLLAVPTGQLAALQQTYALIVTHALPKIHVSPYQSAAQTHLLGILLAGITSVLSGGLYRMALRQRLGEPVSVGGLFSAFPFVLPLLIVGAFLPTVLGLLEGASLWLLHFSLTPARAVTMVNAVAFVPDLLLPALFMFAPLLVVDAGSSAPQALTGSVRLLRGQLWRGIGFYLVVSLLAGIGFLLCGVGMLATYPLLFLSIATGYLALTRPAVLTAPAEAVPAPGVWPPPPRRQ